MRTSWPPIHRVRLSNEEPYAGPLWDPIVWDGKYPALVKPGDIYINRYVEPPLYYIFNKNCDAEPITLEELEAWVTGGLMSPITLVPPNHLPSQTYSRGPKGSSPHTAQQ